MVKEICANAKLAANKFASASEQSKNAILSCLKDLIIANKTELLAANAQDVAKAIESGKNTSFVDRLSLSDARIIAMANGLDDVIALPDPVNEVVEEYFRPNGLLVKRVRAPLGVIGIIFEARPNVAVEAAALCIKSGNGVILRGSRDSVNSVNVLVSLIKTALKISGFSQNLVGNIQGAERALTTQMLQQDAYIDVIIPRGGESLKKVVLENATMPVIASAGGNCHQYVAASADEDMAIKLAINAKISRPSTCNALETLLIDYKKGADFVVKILSELQKNGVEIRGTEEINSVFPVKVIEDSEFYTEYIDMIIKVKFVNGVSEAIAHINKYSTHHSDAIISQDNDECIQFTKEVDSAAVYINVSTRFTDGFELGLGAEMGISTQKLHVRGPVGLKELTSTKYIVSGNGVIR